MPRPVLVFCFSLFGAFQLLATCVSAENWPGWRGPRGDGTSLEKNIPIRWDGPSGENIAWKADVPGSGYASPVVWRDRIFLVSCVEQTQQRILLCLDRPSGAIRWQRTVLECPLETRHPRNSCASSTPATDGRLVYVTFLEVDGSTIPAPNVSRTRPITPGRMIVAAYDFEGNRKWIAKPGEFVSAHGFCSCPVLYKDLVIVNGDHDGDSYIVALDKFTGETIWKTARRHKTRSYATPIIRKVDGRWQMVLSGSKCIVSIDPRDGSRSWWIEGPTEQFVASMVFDGRLFFSAAGFPTYHVMAIRADGSGNVGETHVAWHVTNARCYVPSPVVVGNFLLVADDRGTANCFGTATGERHWQGRLGSRFSGSLVTAGGLVYFPADNGITTIVEPDEELRIVAQNRLGEHCQASPAISHGHIYIRGEDQLFAIGPPERVASESAAQLEAGR